MLPRPAEAIELDCAQDRTQLPEGAPRSGQSPPSDPRVANQKRGHPHHDVKRTRGRSGQNRPSRRSRTTDSLTTPAPLGSPNNGILVLLRGPPFGRTPKCTPLLLTGPGHSQVWGRTPSLVRQASTDQRESPELAPALAHCRTQPLAMSGCFADGMPWWSPSNAPAAMGSRFTA